MPPQSLLQSFPLGSKFPWSSLHLPLLHRWGGGGCGEQAQWKVMMPLCPLLTSPGNRGSEMPWTVQEKVQPVQLFHQTQLHTSSGKSLREALAPEPSVALLLQTQAHCRQSPLTTRDFRPCDNATLSTELHLCPHQTGLSIGLVCPVIFTECPASLQEPRRSSCFSGKLDKMGQDL